MSDRARAAIELSGPCSRAGDSAPTANGQLAFRTYLWDDTAAHYVPGGPDVLTIQGGPVAEVVASLRADLTRFGLPARIRSQVDAVGDV